MEQRRLTSLISSESVGSIPAPATWRRFKVKPASHKGSGEGSIPFGATAFVWCPVIRGGSCVGASWRMVTCACLAGQGFIPEESYWQGHESLKLAAMGSNPISGTDGRRASEELGRFAKPRCRKVGFDSYFFRRWMRSWQGARLASKTNLL